MKDSLLQIEGKVPVDVPDFSRSVGGFEKIREERKGLEEKRDFLEKLEGWERLTDRQKRMILASFSVWLRATRATDEKGASLVTKSVRGMRVEEEEGRLCEGCKRPYRISQTVVSRMFCHSAVSCLENEEVSVADFLGKRGFSEKDVFSKKEWNRYFDIDWFLLGRDKYTSINEEISVVGFPCVVYWSQFESDAELQEWNRKKHFPLVHSCVALGRSGDGDVVFWEKEGRGAAFQTVSLREVCGRYSLATHFSVRPLENKQTLEN